MDYPRSYSSQTHIESASSHWMLVHSVAHIQTWTLKLYYNPQNNYCECSSYKVNNWFLFPCHACPMDMHKPTLVWLIQLLASLVPRSCPASVAISDEKLGGAWERSQLLVSHSFCAETHVSPSTAAVLHMVIVIRPNPLTTDDECTHHATLAACYQLVQSVLKIGFALGRWAGIVMTCRAYGGCLG